MVGTRVELDSAALQAYLDGEHGVREMLRSRAEPVLATAQADPHDDSGNYESLLGIEESHTDRLVVRVVARASYSMALEARYGILARALDAAR